MWVVFFLTGKDGNKFSFILDVSVCAFWRREEKTREEGVFKMSIICHYQLFIATIHCEVLLSECFVVAISLIKTRQ